MYFRKIIKKIDTDEDGSVSLRELAEWIKNVHDNYYVKDANRRFVVLDTDKDGFVTFNEYAKSMGLNGMYICVHVCMHVSVCECVYMSLSVRMYAHTLYVTENIRDALMEQSNVLLKQSCDTVSVVIHSNKQCFKLSMYEPP